MSIKSIRLHGNIIMVSRDDEESNNPSTGEQLPYMILSGEDRFVLQDMVNKAIEMGYEPVGGVAVLDVPEYHRLLQAMRLMNAAKPRAPLSRIDGQLVMAVEYLNMLLDKR